MDNKEPILVRGRIERGLGVGGNFITIPEFYMQFNDILGNPPFPGTLNVRLYGVSADELERIEHLKSSFGTCIEGFMRDGKEYCSGIALHCTIRSIGKENEDETRPTTIKGIIFFPEKTVHPPDILEIISSVRIMDHLGDRDTVEVTIR